jgi:hypothetical protein
LPRLVLRFRYGTKAAAFKPFELLYQILSEEWPIERNQQVGTNFRKPLSPSFGALCFTIAAIFRNLRYIFVTVATINLTL